MVTAASGQAPAAGAAWDTHTLNTAAGASYMTEEEREMVLEINMLRSDPRKYAAYLLPYLEDAKDRLAHEGKGRRMYSLHSTYNGDELKPVRIDTLWHWANEEEVRAIESLLDDLNSSPPLSVLQPDRGIYTAARKHAADQVPTGDINHMGTDGSWPWDRIMQEAPDMKHGNENIACGEADPREIVILLLIDSGIEGYGHRRNLLNPEWTHCACYCAGKIPDGLNCTYWIQNFGTARVK